MNKFILFFALAMQAFTAQASNSFAKSIAFHAVMDCISSEAAEWPWQARPTQDISIDAEKAVRFYIARGDIGARHLVEVCVNKRLNDEQMNPVSFTLSEYGDIQNESILTLINKISDQIN